jgi:hypothetical protein
VSPENPQNTISTASLKRPKPRHPVMILDRHHHSQIDCQPGKALGVHSHQYRGDDIIFAEFSRFF